MHIEVPPRRLAVFSDLHGNIHALEAVLRAIDDLSIRDMVCCGDVVGYGAFPNECVELLRLRNIPTLAGNHDHAALDMTDVQHFNDIARRAVVWTRERLSAENRRWLGERPYTLAMPPEYFFSHASPHEPENWGYVLTFGDARTAFNQFDEHICFIGHSHQPTLVELTEEGLLCPDHQRVSLAAENRYLINVGSVGQPRDRNPMASFVTVDLDTGFIEFQRVDYNIEEAQGAILRNGLPEELAERLAFGW